MLDESRRVGRELTRWMSSSGLVKLQGEHTHLLPLEYFVRPGFRQVNEPLTGFLPFLCMRLDCSASLRVR